MKISVFDRRRFVKLIFALSLGLSFLGTANVAWSDPRTEMRQFHDFLRDHPSIATDLRTNPNLVYNRRYLERHDELDRFLRRHPAVRREVADNPGRALGRYYTSNDYYSPWPHR
jgi:hypothetical protein